jgi:molybdopterin converting factor small subunit
MAIKVRFLANTRNLIGKDEIDLEMAWLPQATARGVLAALAEIEKRDLSSVLRVGEERSYSAVRVVQNGVVLPSLDHSVADGDVLVVLPLLGAG